MFQPWLFIAEGKPYLSAWETALFNLLPIETGLFGWLIISKQRIV